MKPFRLLFFLLLGVYWSASSGAQSATHWLLHIGEMRIMEIPDVARVAVGDGHVINAVTSDDKEVLVFARNPGASTLTVWTQSGGHRTFYVEVKEPMQTQAVHELKELLQRIPQLRVSVVGDQVVVEGAQLTATHRQQLEELKKRYPQILDLSHTMSWEPMVLLDVKVLEIPRNLMQELGVRWADQSEGGLHAGLAWDGGSAKLLDRPGEVVMPLPYQPGAMAGYFGVNALLAARLQALSQTGQAVVLAQPQLLARSGATAEFLAGGEVPYSTTDQNGNANTSFKPYGVSLKITPFLESSGAVRSHVDVEVSSIDPSLSIPTGPSLKTRRASTEFNVQSGQTLVLAGFISRDMAENAYRVPGLHHIPILGQLFQSKRYQRNETELAIFVTPYLVDAQHQSLQQRVNSAQQMINEHFIAPVLNHPIENPVSKVATIGWNPWLGAGSQWQVAEEQYAVTP